MTEGRQRPWDRFMTATASVFVPVCPGGLTLTAMDRVELPVPPGIAQWSDPHSDRLDLRLSSDLSAAPAVMR